MKYPFILASALVLSLSMIACDTNRQSDEQSGSVTEETEMTESQSTMSQPGTVQTGTPEQQPGSSSDMNQ